MSSVDLWSQARAVQASLQVQPTVLQLFHGLHYSGAAMMLAGGRLDKKVLHLTPYNPVWSISCLQHSALINLPPGSALR